MAYNFIGNAIEAGRTQPTQAQPTQGSSMFAFPTTQPTEDKNISSDEAKQLFSGKPPEQRKQIYDKLKGNGYSFADEITSSQPVQPTDNQGFLGGVASKTGEAFMGGIKRIGEAGAGLAEGKYSFPEAAVRGAAGSLQSFLSPISGAIGQSVESFVPDSTKKSVGEFVAPAVQKGQEFYASQSPEQQRNIANIGVGAEVLTNFLGMGVAGKVAGSEAGKVIGKEVGGAIGKVGTSIGRGIEKGVKSTGEAIGSIPEYGISVATGLSKDAQQTIKSIPSVYRQARTGEITRDSIFNQTKTALDQRVSDLSALGSSYKDLRTGKIVAKNNELQNAFKEATKSVDTIDLPISDRNAIAEAKKYIDELKGNITDTQLLAMRKKIDSTISWDKGVSSEGQSVVRGIRASIDDLAKSRIVGLAERDAKFAPEIKFLNTVKNSIYDSKGAIKDNAISTINNLAGKGKEFKIDRFEQILPGITDKIKALKAFEEVQGIGEIKTGSVMRQLGGVASGTSLGGPIGAAIGFALTHPGVASRVLESYGMAKESIRSILDRSASREIEKNAAEILKNAKLKEVEKVILNTNTKNPFKDISFIKKLGSGQVKGLSPEATNIMKGVKTPKEAMARAKQKDIANEVRKVYSTRMSADDIDALEASVAKKDLPVKKESATKPIAPKTQKMETIKNINTSSGKYNSGRLEHQNGFLDYEISGNNMDIDLIKVIDKQKGTGTKLMKEAEKIAKEKGLKQLRLSSQPMDSSISQKDLNSFYEKNGFINNGDNYFVKDLTPVKKSATIKPIAPKTEKMTASANKEEIIYHNTNSTAKDSGKGIFTMSQVDKNVLGGKNTEKITIAPKKVYTSENQFSLYKKLFGEEIPESAFDLDIYDRKIYKKLKEQGYDLIKYTKPSVGRGTENVILDTSIIKTKENIGTRNEALAKTQGKPPQK